MKKRKAAFLALLMLFISFGASAAEARFPDLVFWLDSQGRVLQRDYEALKGYRCDAYAWDYPADWTAAYDEFLPRSAQLLGWVWERAEVDGFTGYRLTCKGETAYILPQHARGMVLVLLPVGCEIVDEHTLMPTPVPTPATKPTTAPAPAYEETAAPPVAGEGRQWGFVKVEEDCPYCQKGECSICNGSGTYRLYGQVVDCPKECASCHGRGTIPQEYYLPLN